jgi:energy-coupling factor transport system permease protein
MTDRLHRVNPFYKFVVIAAIATGLTFIHSLYINIGVFSLCVLLLLIGTKPITWWHALKIFIPLALLGLGVFMSGFLWGNTSGAEHLGTLRLRSTQTGLNMLSRFISFAGLGLLISLTTDSFELVKAMQKNGRLPRKFAYGMLAALNLVPHMKAEYNAARLAFAVRGATVSPLSPKVIFAMLVNCFRWSEMLSIAMHSKGFKD